MNYEFDKHTPSEGTIAAQADAVAKPAGDVESFTGDVTAAHNKSKSTVEGALLTAMTGADEPTKKQARDLVQGITVASAAVRNYATAVGEHNATVDNLNSQIRQEPTQEKKKKKHTALTGKFTNSEETLTEVGRASGRQLNDPLNPENVKALYTAGAMPSTTPALFGDLKLDLSAADHRKALANIVANMTETERQAYVKRLMDDPAYGETVIDYLPVSIRQDLGDQIADRADDIRTSTDEVGADELTDLTKLLDTYGTNSVVAASTLTKLGPRELLELNARVVRAGDDDAGEARGDLQTALGALLAAGTRGVQPEVRDRGPDPGGDDRVSADWIAQLMKAGREEFTIPPPSEDPRANGAGTSYDVYGYQLLGPLLGEGEHSSHFLNHVGTDMLWFEQEYAEDNNGRLPWDDVIRPEPRGPQSHAGVPTPRWTRLDYTEGWDDDDPSGMDPMGGLMEGIGSNPEAAREFFTNETVYAPGEEPQLPRVDYLLHDRDWPTSFTWQGGQDTTTYPNAMNHLGDAFEAATTGEGADERSVDIVEEIVSSTYGQMPSGEDAPRFSEEDILDPRVRESLSNVVGHYMPSVHTGLDATNPNPGVDTSDGSVFNDARFNTNGDERATLLMLAELSKDDAGREILTGYNNAQTFEELLHEMDGIDDPSQITLDTESLIGTQVHGAIDFGANSHAAEEALAADENYNQNVDEAVSVSAGLLKDTKFGSAPGVGTLVDLVSAEIAEANHQDSRGELNSELGAIFADNKDVRATLVRDAIWRSIPPDQLPEGMDGTEDLNNLSGADQAAYDSWLEDNDWGDRMSDVSNRAKTDYGPAVRDAEATLEAYGR